MLESAVDDVVPMTGMEMQVYSRKPEKKKNHLKRVVTVLSETWPPVVIKILRKVKELK